LNKSFATAEFKKGKKPPGVKRRDGGLKSDGGS
jgi:hypothetical protein